MRKLSRKELLTKLFVAFFSATCVLTTVNKALALDLDSPQEIGLYYFNDKDDSVNKWNETDDLKITSLAPDLDPSSELENRKLTVNITATSDSVPSHSLTGYYSDTESNLSNYDIEINAPESGTYILKNITGVEVSKGSVLSNLSFTLNNIQAKKGSGYSATAVSLIPFKIYDGGELKDSHINIQNISFGRQYAGADSFYGAYFPNSSAMSERVKSIVNNNETRIDSSTFDTNYFVGFGHEGLINTEITDNTFEISNSSVFSNNFSFASAYSDANISDNRFIIDNTAIYGNISFILFQNTNNTASRNVFEVKNQSKIEFGYGLIHSDTYTFAGELIADENRVIFNNADIKYDFTFISAYDLKSGSKNEETVESSNIDSSFTGIATGIASSELSENKFSIFDSTVGYRVNGIRIEEPGSEETPTLVTNTQVNIKRSEIGNHVVNVAVDNSWWEEEPYNTGISSSESASPLPFEPTYKMLNNSLTIDGSTVGGAVMAAVGGYENGLIDGNKIEIKNDSSIDGNVVLGVLPNTSGGGGGVGPAAIDLSIGTGQISNNELILDSSTVKGSLMAAYFGSFDEAMSYGFVEPTSGGGGGDGMSGSVVSAYNNGAFNNSLTVKGSDSKARSIEGFNKITFDATGVDANSKMLKLTEKEDNSGLANATINATNVDLEKGEKIVLLNVNDEELSTLNIRFQLFDEDLLEPTIDRYSLATDDVTNNWGIVDLYAYEFGNNEISVVCDDSFIAQNFIDKNGNQQQFATELNLTNAAQAYENVYGTYSDGANDATGAVVNMDSKIWLGDTVIHGGESKFGNVSNNTLNVSVVGNVAKGIEGFDHYNFTLPSDVRSGDTMLTVFNPVEIRNTDVVTIDAEAPNLGKALVDNDYVNLIYSQTAVGGDFEAREYSIDRLVTYNGRIEVLEDEKALRFTLAGNTPAPVDPEPVNPDPEPVNPDPEPVNPDPEPVNPDPEPVNPDPEPINPDPRPDPRPKPAIVQNNKTKAPAEAITAAAATVTDVGNMTSTTLVRSLVELDNTGIENFAGMSGGSMRYETGSHVDANTYNLGVGFGKQGFFPNNPNTTWGLAFLYSKSHFTTHNDDLVGKGDSKALGVGILCHSEFGEDYYLDSSFYIGNVKAQWNSIYGGYEDDATFRGFNLGFGKRYYFEEEHRVLDLYAKYLFSHTNSMSGVIDGLSYSFSAAESRRMRLGFRVENADRKSKTRPFYGLAWEREFGGDACTMTNLGRVDAPTLKGDSGILELGCKWHRGHWDYDFNVEGSTGVRKGVSGNANAFYKF